MNTTVVVISYNSGKFLKANLDSLTRQTVPFKQVIVVDNNSCDDSLKIIAAYPQATAIALGYNSGYAAGANIGIKKSEADLVVVANADVILDERFNEKVIGKFSRDNELALLSPLILRFDKQTVDSAGQVASRARFPVERGFNRPLETLTLKEEPIFSVCGAVTVFRRQALEQLQINGEFYDEDFFIFWEDFDIGWRTRLLGLKTLFFPEAVAYHYRSATLKRNLFSRFSLSLARSPFIKYHLVKNRYLTLIKNFRLKQDWAAIPFIILKDIVWVTLLTTSAPKIIIQLMKCGKYVRRALAKRKMIKERQ